MLTRARGALADWIRTPGGIIGSVVLLAGFAIVYERAGSFDKFSTFTVLGLARGSIYAIAAAGIVLTYTTTGVFNFAHGAIGMAAAFLFWKALDVGVPVPMAVLLIVVVFGPLVGLGFERIMRSFKEVGPGATVTVTIALTVLILGVMQALFPPANYQLGNLLGGDTVEIFGANVTRDDLLVLGLGAVIAVGLRWLLFGSRTGTAMRAVVDNPDLAALNGAPPKLIARYSWVLGCSLAALAGVLIAAGTNLSHIELTFFVVGSFGAAVFGRLKSLPLTFAGALLLGLAVDYSVFALPQTQVWSKVGPALPGLFLFFALLLLAEERLSAGRLVGRDEPRVPSGRSSIVRVLPFMGAVILIAQLTPGEYMIDVTRGLVYALLMLSLVLLTGYGGQISLAQYVFLGLGAWAMGSVFSTADANGFEVGGSSIVGLLAATVVAVPLGVVVALPALRLKGLYLALVTFALATISNGFLFQQPEILGNEAQPVGRLQLLGLDFSGDRMFMGLCGLVFAAVAVFVLVLRRGPFGRRLAALRDSEAACATLGLDVRRTKLSVFVLSAAIAGLAGALFGGLNGTASDIQFVPENNIVMFLFAYVGGITTVTGALIGGLLFSLLPLVQSEASELAGLVFAAIAVAALLLGRQPNGMAGLLYGALDRLRGTTPTVGTEPAAAGVAASHHHRDSDEASPEEVIAGATPT